MYLRIFEEQGEYVAVAPGAKTHAFGATEDEAIRELMLELDEFHRDLRAAVPRLSVRMQRTLDYLERWRPSVGVRA